MSARKPKCAAAATAMPAALAEAAKTPPYIADNPATTVTPSMVTGQIEDSTSVLGQVGAFS